VVPLEVREELWLRRVLRRHLRLTGSPRAAHLLSAELSLPFLRVEPVQPPCSVADTWRAILARLRKPGIPAAGLPQTIPSEGLAVM